MSTTVTGHELSSDVSGRRRRGAIGELLGDQERAKRTESQVGGVAAEAPPNPPSLSSSRKGTNAQTNNPRQQGRDFSSWGEELTSYHRGPSLPPSAKMKGHRAEGKNTERRHRRFLLCFRPSAITTDSPKGLAGRPASSDPVPKAFDYFSNEETSPKRKKKQPSASEDLSERRRRKFRPLSGIKAAIFGSSKGASRSGRVQQDPSRSSDTSENVSNEPVPAEIHREQSPKYTVSTTHKTESNSVTSSSSSSCSVFGVSKTSSCSSRRKLDSAASSAESEESVHSPSPRPRVRRTPSPTRISAPTGGRGLDPVTGFCYLLAISLLTTLIWGQIPAVICTSIWLYFFGRTRGRLWPGSRRRGECLLDPSVIGSRDYHKRVIMEGILDRHHHHHRASSPADQ